MLRTFVMTLACLGAGTAPGIAEELQEMERGQMLTPFQMDRITAGLSAVEVLGNGISASAEAQSANSSSSSALAQSEISVDGEGNRTLVFDGFAESSDDVVTVPVVPTPSAPVGNRASALLLRP